MLNTDDAEARARLARTMQTTTTRAHFPDLDHLQV